MAYTTGTEVKAIVDTDKSADDIDADVVPVIEAQIDQIVGFSFSQTEDTVEYHDGDRSGIYPLRCRPVTAVSKLEVRETSDSAFDEIDSDDYFVRSDVVNFLTSEDVIGLNNVRVTYDHGFAAVPDDIHRAATLMCVAYIVRDQAVDYSEQQIMSGVPVTNWEGMVPAARDRAAGELTGDPQVDDILTRWREKHGSIGSV